MQTKNIGSNVFQPTGHGYKLVENKFWGIVIILQLLETNEIFIQASLAVVDLEGVANVVNVLISKGIPIIGISLLRRYGYALNMNVKYNSLILRK